MKKIRDLLRNLRAKFVNPYTPYFDEYKCIFVHIPKTAGMSISTALFGSARGHVPIKYFELFDKKRYGDYFKFTFVRNPWDRIVSAFHYLKKGARGKPDRQWAAQNLSKFDDFKSFVLSLTDEEWAKKVMQWPHFRTQTSYVCDDDLTVKVDFIGKFENLKSDFTFVKKKLDIDCELGHLNKGKAGAYAKYYDPETRQIVAKLYKDDIEVFGYTFVNNTKKR